MLKFPLVTDSSWEQDSLLKVIFVRFDSSCAVEDIVSMVFAVFGGNGFCMCDGCSADLHDLVRMFQVLKRSRTSKHIFSLIL